MEMKDIIEKVNYYAKLSKERNKNRKNKCYRPCLYVRGLS